MNAFGYLILAIITEVIGTSALRASEGFTRWLPGAVVIIAYGAAFFLLSLALKQIPLGTAYAIWSGIGTAVTAAVGVIIFRDSINVWGIAGMVIIIIGVVILNVFSSRQMA